MYKKQKQNKTKQKQEKNGNKKGNNSWEAKLKYTDPFCSITMFSPYNSGVDTTLNSSSVQKQL